MRRVCMFVGALGILALGADLVPGRSAVAANAGSALVSDQPQAEPQQAALQPVSDGCPCEDDDAGRADCRGRGNCRSRALSKRAEVGNFNCSCRGSYKFPVPPQYTYHWPGMYSQRTMTEYNSPYRFPNLKEPPIQQAAPEPAQQVGALSDLSRLQVEQVSGVAPPRRLLPPHGGPSSRPASAIIKRHYGMD